MTTRGPFGGAPQRSRVCSSGARSTGFAGLFVSLRDLAAQGAGTWSGGSGGRLQTSCCRVAPTSCLASWSPGPSAFGILARSAWRTRRSHFRWEAFEPSPVSCSSSGTAPSRSTSGAMASDARSERRWSESSSGLVVSLRPPLSPGPYRPCSSSSVSRCHCSWCKTYRASPCWRGDVAPPRY